MKRREAREQAFILAFEQSINQETISHIIDAAGMSRDLIADEFAEKLAQGVEEHREELDEIIGRYIRGWKMNRISKTALTILRMAVYEIRFEKDIPRRFPSMKPWSWQRNTAPMRIPPLLTACWPA